MPVGVTAWISFGEEEPRVVSVPVGITRDPADVDVPAGRIRIVLRNPAGRCGSEDVLLAPGESKVVEFGRATPESTIETFPFTTTSLEIPVAPTNPLVPPADPWHVEQIRPPAFGRPRSGGNDLAGGPLAGGGWGGSNSGGGWGPSGRPRLDAWMPQIHQVRVYSQKRPGSGGLVECSVRKTKVPADVCSIESSTERLELGMAGCFAFVVELTAPYEANVLFHRAAWTHDVVTFLVKPRHDETAVPIDTEVVLADDRVMPLLSFLASGDIPSARAQAERFSEAAAGYLSRKFTDHHLAAVGAYALLALREADRYAGWILRLYEYFDDISDGAILYAMHLMRARPGAISEWYDEARNALVIAANRPIPMLTAGVHLLAEGLERLSSSRRAAGDEALMRALVRARWIRARSRPDEIFTALWLDRHDLAGAFWPYNPKGESAAH